MCDRVRLAVGDAVPLGDTVDEREALGEGEGGVYRHASVYWSLLPSNAIQSYAMTDTNTRRLSRGERTSRLPLPPSPQLACALLTS